jgi:hypothetical protein
MDQRRLDEHLVAVFNELIELGREAKQAMWVVQRGSLEDAVKDLMNSVFGNASTVADLEATIDGRSSAMVSPSARDSPSLIVESEDAGGVIPLLVERARSVGADVRRRGDELGTSEIGALLQDIADELDRCITGLIAQGGD